MNVITMYKGDADTALSWMQHDCYWHTIEVIREILKDSLKDLKLPNLDHRTVQNFHDILAAGFRYAFHKSSGYKKASQDVILGKDLVTHQIKKESEIIYEWHNWLKNNLVGENQILKELVNVYFNQNTLAGYEFEKKVEFLLLKKFEYIPWIGLFQEKLNVSNFGYSSEKSEEKHYVNKSEDLNKNSLSKLDILNLELDQLNKNIKSLKEKGAEDTYDGSNQDGVAPLINWNTEAFFRTRSGWSYYDEDEYKNRKNQLERKLLEGAGCVYVLGVIGKDNLCKIGFTNLAVHKRAKDYGSKYGLSFYVVDVISSDNAKALEKRVHELISSSQFQFKGAKEIFELSPDLASQRVRSLEPSTGRELINRELQWLLLEVLKKKSQQAKEVWNIVDRIYDENKHVLSESNDFSSPPIERQIEIFKYHNLLIKEIERVREKKNIEKIHNTKLEIKKKSKARWHRRYGLSIPTRKRKVLKYSISFITMFLIAIMLIF